jgi:predicted RNA-binding protein with PUA-like domain
MPTAAAHWLVKSEPDAFSWDQQVANRVEPWTGVRNHMAKNNLKAMKRGDLAFFYHSNEGMEAVAPMPRPVTLAEIKATPELADLALVRMSRLSVLPVSAAHWKLLCRMGGCRREPWAR